MELVSGLSIIKDKKGESMQELEWRSLRPECGCQQQVQVAHKTNSVLLRVSDRQEDTVELSCHTLRQLVEGVEDGCFDQQHFSEGEGI